MPFFFLPPWRLLCLCLCSSYLLCLLQLLPSLLQPLPLWDPLALVLELQLEMEPKTLPLPQALLRAPVLELPRMLKQAFELQLNLSKRGQLGMQSTIVGSESTGEPATSTFASGFNACSRTWTQYRSIYSPERE